MDDNEEEEEEEEKKKGNLVRRLSRIIRSLS